jgi:Protein of unknown function (DUF3455)
MQTWFRFPISRIAMFGLMTAVGIAAAAAAPKKDIVVPPVPANLAVPVGNSVYRVGHAIGTQDYVCLPCPTTSPACTASGIIWTFFGPQATLFDDGDEQIITHFLSRNSDEGGTPRATWQDSRDSSAVWAFAPAANQSADPHFVAPGAIPWLRLQVVGTRSGPTDGDRLTVTTFIQRLNTAGGVAPATADCSSRAAVGKTALVSYEADYFFYRARPPHGQGRDDDNDR